MGKRYGKHMENSRRRNDLIVIATAYFSFIGLGLVYGPLGLAWAYMQVDFKLPLDAVGILLLSAKVGYLLSSFYSGQMVTRIGYGKMLVLSSGLITAGLFGYAFGPVWGVVVISAFVSNLGVGLIDAGMNSYMSENHSARALNWMHACFGIGVTAAPLIMTVTLQNFASWRWGYLVIAVIHIGFTLALFYVRKRWRSRDTVKSALNPNPLSSTPIQATLRQPIVWLSIAVFFLYSGLESIPGQWVYTLFTGARSVSEVDAGLWVSIYWGSFTVGRVFFGAIIAYVNPMLIMRLCMGGMLLGTLLLWWNPVNEIGFFGLTLLGFAEAPLFPILVAATSRRVGKAHAPNAIGFQIAGSGIGIAILPGLAGVLARAYGLHMIMPLVFVICIAMIVLHEIIAGQSRPQPEPQPVEVHL